MFAALTAPDFCTDRQNVFRIEIKPSEICNQRSVFLGFLNDEETPFPVVTATVWVHGPYYGHTLEAIHTQDAYRLQGLATELWLGIEQHLDGVLWSDSGMVPALVAAVDRAHLKTGRQRPDYNNPRVAEQIEREFKRQRSLEGQNVATPPSLHK